MWLIYVERMKSFSLSIPTYNSHSTTPGCCCFKIHGNKKRVFKSDLWAFWTCVFYNKIISKQDFQIVEFTLSTLVLLKLPRCCHLHHIALLTTLAHPHQSRVPHLPLHQCLSVERVAGFDIQSHCLPSPVVPIQTLTTHQLVWLHSLQVFVAQEAVLYHQYPQYPQ